MDNLIEQCKNNSRAAQEALFEKYSTNVYRTALIFSRSRTLADDITQEAFIRIFQKIHMYDESFSFDAWIYRLVINVAKNIIRKHRWEKLLCILSEDDSSNEFKDSSNILEIKEHEVLINSLISKLSEKYKEIIVLKYFNNFSQEEIANILQIPIGTVKSRLNTALNKLRKFINSNQSIKEVLFYE